jgi:hypothetical protein
MCVGFNPQRQAVKSLGWKNTATRFPLYVGYYHASDGIPGAWNVGTHGGVHDPVHCGALRGMGLQTRKSR